MTINEKSILRAQIIKWITRVFLILVAIVMMFPLVWNIYSSFKTNTEFLTNAFALPSGLEWDNYVRAIAKSELGANIFNSLFGNKVSPDLIAWDGIAVCIASMFAGPLAALISEKSGSYQLAGYIATAIFAVCVLLLLYLTSDKTREHIKEIDAPYKEKEQA